MTQYRVPTGSVGEDLREDFLPDFNIKAPTLATRLDVPRSRVVRLLDGARCDGDMALRLARLFGTTPQFWLNLQALHDLSTTQAETGDAITRAVKPLQAARGAMGYSNIGKARKPAVHSERLGDRYN